MRRVEALRCGVWRAHVSVLSGWSMTTCPAHDPVFHIAHGGDGLLRELNTAAAARTMNTEAAVVQWQDFSFPY